MEEQTSSLDALVDLEWPVNLRQVDKGPFLFFLAGKVPIPITDLAPRCNRDEAQVRKILHQRFQSEIKIDQTGFLDLADAARSPVVSYGKQFISQAKEESNQAAELREEGHIKSAVAQFTHAAELLSDVRKRFAAVNYVPDQLEGSVTRMEKNADSLRKKHAKDVNRHRNLLSNQREKEGNEAFKKADYAVAETKFREAHGALQQALEKISNYNENRLFAESPRLRTDTLEDRLEALQRKYTHASESQNTESADSTQPNPTKEDYSPEGGSVTSSNPDAPSEESLLEAVNDLAHQLGKAPTTTDMKERGRFEPHQYYEAFGKWRDALEQAGLNVQSDLISDLRRVADDLEKRPTSSDMDKHGRYAGHWYGEYFETWDEALDAADIEEPTEEELIAEIRRLDRENARIPSANLMRDEGKYSLRSFRDRFGSWSEALEASGIDKHERLIEELKRVNSECNGRLTTSIANDISTYSPTYFSNEFGSWSKALEAAGIEDGSESGQSPDETTTAASENEVETNSKQNSSSEPTDKELLEELRRLDRDMVGIPSGNSMMNRGAYTTGVYFQRFGSWDDALDAAGISPNTTSDRIFGKRETDSSKERSQEKIPPNELAELYESLRVLNKILIDYIDAIQERDLGADEPVTIWQSVIEDVAVGEGINASLPCLGQLHADRNPFSMTDYREQYGDGDRITEFKALAVAEIGEDEYSKLLEASDSTPPKPRLPVVPGKGRPLPTLLSSETQLSQALTQLEELLTMELDIANFDPPSLTRKVVNSNSPTTSKSPTSVGADSDVDPLTLADVEPNATYHRPLVGRLIGFIASPSGEYTSQLHLEDIDGDQFWLYIRNQGVDHQWENGNWYFISGFSGPEELGGGRGDQALQGTSQLSIEDQGTTLPPAIDADVSDTASSRTGPPSSGEERSRQSGSDGRTVTASSRGNKATSSRGSSSGGDRSDSESDEEIDPMVDHLLDDMENEDIL